MIYSITSSIDSTLYEQYETQNAGLDEVLEITKTISESNTNNTFNTRILTKFDITHVSQSIVDGEIPATVRSVLKLYTHTAEKLPYSYAISAYAVVKKGKTKIPQNDHRDHVIHSQPLYDAGPPQDRLHMVDAA